MTQPNLTDPITDGELARINAVSVSPDLLRAILIGLETVPLADRADAGWRDRFIAGMCRAADQSDDDGLLPTVIDARIDLLAGLILGGSLRPWVSAAGEGAVVEVPAAIIKTLAQQDLILQDDTLAFDDQEFRRQVLSRAGPLLQLGPATTGARARPASALRGRLAGRRLVRRDHKT